MKKCRLLGRVILEKSNALERIKLILFAGLKELTAIISLLVLVVSTSLLSCRKQTPSEPMQSLRVDAGPDQTVRVGQYAILDGSGSTSVRDDTLKYKWSANSLNPVYVYVDPENVRQTPGFPIAGVYRFSLVVSNGHQDSEPDEVSITVVNRDTVPFDDSCLELSVRYALNIPHEQIADNILMGLDSLKSFSLYHKISSIEGIERCYNLKYVLFSLQNIKDITLLSHLKSLEFLRLDQNRRIVDITPLSGLASLRYLDLQSNQLVEISALSNLRSLTYLNIMDNEGIHDISVIANLTQLKELWVQFSPLNSISALARLTQLNTLWMTSCSITDIQAVSSLAQLEILDLDGNSISDIAAIKNLRELKMLYLGDNEIVDISALHGLDKLERLRLWYNHVTNIQPLVENAGLGVGDVVMLRGNPLDSVSLNVHIPALRNRGVAVMWP